jgi:2-polyprenyl-6-hydroxyphenyl methylase/3-demethylubiquinone-9 3-methyltransferase
MTEYSDYHYKSYGPSNGQIGEALAARFVRITCGLPQVRSICDLGCGNGYLSGLLVERGFQVVGVDASASGVAIANAALGERASFTCARIDSRLAQKLGAGRFDAVVSSDVIEHLYRPRDLIESARGLLNAGGWLVLGTPYHGYLKNLALSVVGRWDAHHSVAWDGGHIKFFSVKTLSRMVMDAGFEVRRFHYFGRLPWLWMNMICVARAPKAK